MFVRKLLISAVVPLALLASACGGPDSGSGGSGATSSASAAAPTAGQSTDSAMLKKIQKCLKAAGISVGARPSGAPSGMPSGGSPSGRPSGIPSGAPQGGGGAAFNNPQIQQALKACGLDFPSAPPSNGGQ